MKTLLACLLLCSFPLVAQDIVGFWKSVDEDTHKAQSIVAIYPYQGKYYGRIVATFGNDGKVGETYLAPKERAPGVEGNPYYAGMDIIWDIKKKDDMYTDGKIIDPEKGKIYDAELWIEGNNLIVRGEIAIFGRNQTWPPAQESDFPPGFKKPDLSKLVPIIPEVEKE